MTEQSTENPNSGEPAHIETLLDAALMHVAFDGWTEASFSAAVADCDMDPVLARALSPRGSVDLALAYHRRGDRLMLERLATEDLTGLRFRDKIAAAVRFRLEAVEDKEAVRRGVTLFALPTHAADGAKAIWGTVDAIWTALGDTSEDINWYSKRATLSGVYSSTVLYWLGDDTPGHHATWEFLDRRIDNVMQFEKLKADVQKNPLLKPLLAGPSWLAGQIRKPKMAEDMPGRGNSY
ncbi:COQ9 family protein [Phycobacter azelaicus]|uniref:COQ9 family protein n=1 Tax=Phycobacter azelaicus TaxID=2668075 RepID=UPI001868AB03|nr:COQ9 family protein [Phycobacter azelaicus]MBE1296124.1 COQ9 family protein [Paracoccaceae bacterium]